MTVAEQHHITSNMRPYILSALMYVFGDKCAICGKTSQSYDIDHMRYGDNVTIYDLQLLCGDCHRAKSSVSHEAYLSKTPHCPTCTCFNCA